MRQYHMLSSIAITNRWPMAVRGQRAGAEMAQAAMAQDKAVLQKGRQGSPPRRRVEFQILNAVSAMG